MGTASGSVDYLKKMKCAMKTNQKIGMGVAALVLGMAFASGQAFAQYGPPFSGPFPGPFAGPSSLNFNAVTKGSMLNDSTLGGAQTGPIFNFGPQPLEPVTKHPIKKKARR